MKINFKISVILILILFSSSLMAWNYVGHRVVAHIAYDHLTPAAKDAVDQLTDEGKDYTPRSRFVYISTWADWARDHGDKRFRHWHYIDLPLSEDGWPTRPPRASNAVYGINHCNLVLKNPNAEWEDQQTCLKLLVHIVGDIHQPLHAATLYSQRHPKGDHGGNSFKIKSRIAENLHLFWDRGLGEFRPYEKSKAQKDLMIHLYAKGIQQRYPLKHFRQLSDSTFQSAQDQNKLKLPPLEWALESRALAESFVYQLDEDTSPYDEYIEQGRAIAEERLALAGYRLAAMLNTIYNDNN